MRVVATILVAVMALLAACAPAAVPAPSPTTTSSSAVPSPSPAQAQGQAPLTPLRIGVPATAVGLSYLYVANDLGFFRQHGLDAQLVTLSPSAITAALTNGDIDVSATTASTIRAALQGFPVRVFAVTELKPAFMLVGAPGITRADQLRGQTIASDDASSTTTEMLASYLSAQGLNAGDYTLVSSPAEAGRAALLTTGQVSAAMLELGQGVSLQQQGYPVIANAGDLPAAPFGGLGATTASLQSNQPLLRACLAAIFEAMDAMQTQKDASAQVIAQELGTSLPDARQLLDQIDGGLTPDGRPTDAANAYEFANDQQALHLPTPITPDQVYDFSLLSQPPPPQALRFSVSPGALGI